MAIKHGLHGHELYGTWNGMRARCHRKSAINYDKYGGAGIVVCEEWRHSPVEFIKYVEKELGRKPSSNHSIDRIDNYKGYQPNNIRWATKKEQGRNRGDNTLVDGVVVGVSGKITLVEACEATGISRVTIKQRMKSGLTIEEAFSHKRHAKCNKDAERRSSSRTNTGVSGVSKEGNKFRVRLKTKYVGVSKDLTEAVAMRLASEECSGLNFRHKTSARVFIDDYLKEHSLGGD